MQRLLLSPKSTLLVSQQLYCHWPPTYRHSASQTDLTWPSFSPLLYYRRCDLCVWRKTETYIFRVRLKPSSVVWSVIRTLSSWCERQITVFNMQIFLSAIVLWSLFVWALRYHRALFFPGENCLESLQRAFPLTDENQIPHLYANYWTN